MLDSATLDRLPGFAKRTRWFLENRRDLAQHITYMAEGKTNGQRRFLLAIPSRPRLERVLRYMLDENEFLSPFGIRSLSRIYKDNPYVLRWNSREHTVKYTPAESDNRLFGGNSNWRGPIWFPVNYLLIEALERYHRFYGQTLQVECPTNSGRLMDLKAVADELSTRLMRIFLPDASGCRPAHAHLPIFTGDPHWRDLIWFYECFDGDTGRGVGASHQTGWTALVARMLEDSRCAATTEQAAEPGPSWRQEPVATGRRRPEPSEPAQRTTSTRAAASRRGGQSVSGKRTSRHRPAGQHSSRAPPAPDGRWPGREGRPPGAMELRSRELRLPGATGATPAVSAGVLLRRVPLAACLPGRTHWTVPLCMSRPSPRDARATGNAFRTQHIGVACCSTSTCYGHPTVAGIFLAYSGNPSADSD